MELYTAPNIQVAQEQTIWTSVVAKELRKHNEELEVEAETAAANGGKSDAVE